MHTRILPRDEWSKLAGTELEMVWPLLPAGALVVVVEDRDKLAACWALFPLLHAEGAYVAPEYRCNPRVIRRLLRGMTQTALAMGYRTVQTAAVSDQVAGFAQRLGGVELPPARHFSICISAKNDGQ